jgi:hypothetical protein
MAKVWIERAYIEPFGEEEQDNFTILIHIKETDAEGKIDHIFAGKIELDAPIKWLYTENSNNGDLMINNSQSMEANKWNYLTKEIIGGEFDE